MRTALIALLLFSLSACRFEQSISAPLDLDTQALIGDWKAADGQGRAIISDLRYGRVRMLVKEGEQGMVMDGHVIKLGGQRYLQTHLLALLGENKEQLPLPAARWMIWKLGVSKKVITLQAAREISFSGDSRQSIIASTTRELKNPDNFDAQRQWKWVGSDKPAKL